MKNDYVYEVVVHKKYLTKAQQAILETAPVELPAWDSLAQLRIEHDTKIEVTTWGYWR